MKGGSGLLPFTYVPANSTASMGGSPLHLTAEYVELRSLDGGGELVPRVLRIMPEWWFDSIPVQATLLDRSVSRDLGRGDGRHLRALDRWRVDQELSMLLPPVAIVDAIEFYHASFDHYFMSADTIEINALDTGYFAGWARTGY